jgi:hypothetical protein
MQIASLEYSVYVFFAMKFARLFTGSSTTNDILLIAVPLFSFALGRQIHPMAEANKLDDDEEFRIWMARP